MGLIQQLFKEYYSENKMPTINQFTRREFGFLFFTGKKMLRHQAFSSPQRLQNFLIEKIPAHVYYSTALYDYPTSSMGRKGWRGADLIFDIDADHLSTPCLKIHDRWVCKSCGLTGRGTPPKRCPVCSSEKFIIQKWFCEECIETARKHTINLIDFLEEDFGFSRKDFSVAFSGQRGFHVSVENKIVRELDSNARREIVGYLAGSGIDLQYLGFPWEQAMLEGGWAQRIYFKLRKFLSQCTVADLEKIGVTATRAEILLQNKRKIEKSWSRGGPWLMVKGVGERTWKKLANYVISKSVAIVDGAVTMDLHRLIRFPESLHGKTGLKKTIIHHLDSFDIQDAVAFKKGTLRVQIEYIPTKKILGYTFPSTKKMKATVPTAVGVLLILKGGAKLVT